MSLKTKFTELSKLNEDWVKRGLIYDTTVIYGGKGYADLDPSQVHQKTTDTFAVGSLVAMGNQMGKIDKVYVDDGVTHALKVIHSAITPLEYFSAPDEYGNHADNPFLKTSILKLTDMKMDDFLTLLAGDDATTEITDLSSPDLNLRSILVFKNKTDDVSTWSQIAQDLVHAGYTQVPELIEMILDPEIIIFNIHGQTGDVTIEDVFSVGFRRFPSIDTFKYSIAGDDNTVTIDDTTGVITVPDAATLGYYVVKVTADSDENIFDMALLIIIDESELESGLSSYDPELHGSFVPDIDI